MRFISDFTDSKKVQKVRALFHSKPADRSSSAKCPYGPSIAQKSVK